MNFRIYALAAALLCMGLTACGGKGEPKGQVVARVGKDEITVLDLQSEMAGFQAPNAAVRKIAEQRALNGIVQRKLLAQAAEKEKIDRSPEYARQREQVDEALLVRTWQERLARAVPAPSPEEVQKFIGEHPDLYAEHKVIAVQGLRFNSPSDASVIKGLQPLNTLEEVVSYLTSRNIPFKDASGEMDTLSVDPRAIDQLMKLKPQEVFVVPQGNLVLVGRINGVRVVPLAAGIANRHAANFLRSTRTQEALTRRMSPVVTNGMKDVKYAKAYEPPKPPKPPKAPAAPKAAPAKAG